MQPSFSQLVWLGAGNATEPAKVLYSAAQATLFEAREAACLNLKKQYCQPEIHVVQTLLTEHGAPVEFTEYNLAEYSAIKAATGLKEFFPGLQKLNTEQYTSTSVAEAVSNLQLSDNNNLLIVDITDSNLALLQALEQNHLLTHFRELHVQSSVTALYTDAATKVEISHFLEQNGFLLQHTNSRDPDLPWLCFGLNPLWQQMQETKNSQSILNTNLEKIQQELVAVKQQLTDKNTELSALNIERDQVLAQQVQLQQELINKNAELASSCKERDLALVRQVQFQQKLENKNIEFTALCEERDQALAQFNKKASENEILEKQKITAKTIADEEQEKLNERISVMGAEIQKALQQLDKSNQHSTTLNEKIRLQDNEIGTLKQQLDAVKAQVAKKESELNSEIKAHEKSKNLINENQFRNQLLEQEVIKLEAQIELITTIIIREKVF